MIIENRIDCGFDCNLGFMAQSVKFVRVVLTSSHPFPFDLEYDQSLSQYLPSSDFTPDNWILLDVFIEHDTSCWVVAFADTEGRLNLNQMAIVDSEDVLLELGYEHYGNSIEGEVQ
ncbi:hypothetical protein GSF04_21325 [Pseudoalteromonas sp. A22]|uniref:hypothetical protein n=1 Tax=Pseudoalteromonas sp. A22 TaxID=327511 RepID=UPI001BA49670|nr:hypothetical protein [Pseudoalteromonas sp. A22]QUI64881.1 hypothetical protein GSF04_21325 [Pseudoalteromonas sp. A22]